MIKTVQKKEEFFIEFTDEEMNELGFKPNTKFTVELSEDKSGLKLIPHEEIDIDLNEFSKEELINLIVAANEKDMTFEDFLVDSLTKFCEVHKDEDEGSIL
jgi:negative regulator of genetic competence, sporulation and motility